MGRYSKYVKSAIQISTYVCLGGAGLAVGAHAWSQRRQQGQQDCNRLNFKEWVTSLSVCQPTVYAVEPFPTSVSKWDFNWDRRDPAYILEHRPKRRRHSFSTDAKAKGSGDNGNGDAESKPEKLKPTCSRHLILIRHGQYKLQGQFDEDRTLTELGEEQSLFTGERLRSLGYNYSILYFSTMARATETMKLILTRLGDVPTKSCDLIREGAPIPPEPPLHGWRPEAQYFEDGARIEAGFRKYFHRADVDQEKDSFEIMVCHANVIRYYVCRALQFPPEGWLRISLPNASITWLTIRPDGRVSLRALGDSGHLPPDKVTTT